MEYFEGVPRGRKANEPDDELPDYQPTDWRKLIFSWKFFGQHKISPLVAAPGRPFADKSLQRLPSSASPSSCSSSWSRRTRTRYYRSVNAELICCKEISQGLTRAQKLTPVAEKIRAIPAGWLIPIVILIVLSFPPLFGHEIIALLTGLVYGLGVGFGIVAAGTVFGESKASPHQIHGRSSGAKQRFSSRDLVRFQIRPEKKSAQVGADKPQLWCLGTGYQGRRILGKWLVLTTCRIRRKNRNPWRRLT